MELSDRLLANQLGLRLRDIQVFPTNQYDVAVHRIFQVTANLYEATTTNVLPAVFRPLFESRSNGVFLAGFTNDHRVSTLGAWLESNTNGLPLVIGAKKGIPNFNEFTLRSDILVQRRLQVTRASTNSGTRPNGTNQMYVLGVSNYFGVEAWNSYELSPYPRAVSIAVSNFATVTLWNAQGVQTNAFLTLTAQTNFVPGQWRGGEAMGFALPLSTNTIFLSNAVYRFDENVFLTGAEAAFESTPGFPLPYWIYGVSNRLTYLLSEPDGQDERIIDFVILRDGQTVDLFRELVAVLNPYSEITGISAAIGNLWNTNRAAPDSPTVGIRQQLDIALGNVTVPNSEWRGFGLSTTVNETDKQRAIDAFRAFCGFAALSTNQVTNLGTSMILPFNPAAKVAVVKTWEVDDPLVHYHLDDLQFGGSSTNFQYLRPTQPATNIPPSSLGRLNDRYSPWGGRPNSSYEAPTAYSRSLKDPGVTGSADWNFPSGMTLSSDWPGRVHRGTPWQTIYLKSDAAPLGGATGWTNQSPDVVQLPDGSLFSRTHPTNDWRMAAWLAQSWNTNDPRALISINATNTESWKARLAGLTVLSNNLSSPVLGQPPRFETNTIALDSPQLDGVIEGLERARAFQKGGYFADVAAFLSVPELSAASPWLNVSGDQLRWGLTDEAYEILPAQLLSLVRPDSVGTAVHTGNALELRFTAFDGLAYRLEGSDDFADWQPVSGPHVGVNGAFSVTMPLSAPWRFFRAVLLP
jgi:hypothetical protein